jgi:hypothetical protein
MRALVIIATEFFLRNFITSGAFAEVEEGYETFYLGTNDVFTRAPLEARPGFRGILEMDPGRTAAFTELLNVLMVEHRDRSLTFPFRRKRLNPHKLCDPYTFVEDSPILLAAAKAGLMAMIGENRQLRQLMQEIKPDIVLLPDSVVKLSTHDAIVLARQMGIPSFVLIDNWDNISSKTVYPLLPDWLGVWGEQSVPLARRVHQMPAERILLTGTPRFDHYFRLDLESLQSPYPFPYILFVGSGVAFDELPALKRLDQIVDSLGRPELKIVYRPHPERQVRYCPNDVFNPAEYRHVHVDADQLEYHAKRSRGQIPRNQVYLSPLDYYPALISCAELVVCPPSTMMVEAALLNTPVLLLAYVDPYHYTSPHRTLQVYENLHGVERVECFHFCRQFDHLEPMLRELLATYARIPKGQRNFRDQVRFITHFRPGETYGQRLRRYVDRILGRRERTAATTSPQAAASPP